MDDADDGALTDAGFDKIIQRHRAEAEALLRSSLPNGAWRASGFAVEIALKRRILRVNLWNAWPSRTDATKHLYVHSIRTLAVHAGITDADVPAALRGSWMTVKAWDREHDYTTATMRLDQAKAMFDAAFGSEGIIQWLR